MASGDSRPDLELGYWNFFFVPSMPPSLFTLLLLRSSSVSLSYSILAVPMHKCLRKPSCMSSTFPTAMNGF